MSIFLSKNEKHRQEMEREKNMNDYRQRMKRLSDELVNWLREKDMSISEFETLVVFTRERFQLSFGKVRINEIKESKN